MIDALLLPGAPERARLDEIQRSIAEPRAELDSIERQGKSKAETLAGFQADVARFRQRHPSVSLQLVTEGPQLPRAAAESVLAWVLEVAGDQGMIDILMRQREATGRPFGLPREEREARISELRAQITRASREEELEVLRLEDAGHTVLRRADIDARLVLSVWAERYGETEPEGGRSMVATEQKSGRSFVLSPSR